MGGGLWGGGGGGEKHPPNPPAPPTDQRTYARACAREPPRLGATPLLKLVTILISSSYGRTQCFFASRPQKSPEMGHRAIRAPSHSEMPGIAIAGQVMSFHLDAPGSLQFHWSLPPPDCTSRVFIQRRATCGGIPLRLERRSCHPTLHVRQGMPAHI